MDLENRWTRTVEAILQGKQPPALTLTRLIEADQPLSWADQHRKFGLFAQ